MQKKLNKFQNYQRICVKIVVYDDTRENKSAYIENDRDTKHTDISIAIPDIEHVEAEVVTAEEFEEIRRREQEKREERETEALFRVINEKSERGQRKETV